MAHRDSASREVEVAMVRTRAQAHGRNRIEAELEEGSSSIAPLLSIGVPWNEISVKRGTLIGTTWNSYRLSVLYALIDSLKTHLLAMLDKRKCISFFAFISNRVFEPGIMLYDY